MSGEEAQPDIIKYQASQNDKPLRQGEILSDLIQLTVKVDEIGREISDSKETGVSFTAHLHPYAIVVSQDCDLDWDYKSRKGKAKEHKKIPSILFCEITEAQKLAAIILEIDNSTNVKKSQTWSRIKINKDERYQFLEGIKETEDALGLGIKELGVDFKRYFTIPTDEVYKRIELGEAQRRCVLKSPYLEHFMSRFYFFQARVALPQEYESDAD